jgi:hypothetical protein
MFNRTYQLRAVKKAGGGRKLAEDASLCLPWAGIFRPKQPWRSTVLMARAAEAVETPPEGKPAGGLAAFHRPEPPVREGIAFARRKNRSRKLQGIQLELFPERDQRFYHPQSAASEVVVRISAHDSARPLADVFPEAYLP